MSFFRRLFSRKPAASPVPSRFDWRSPEGRELIAAKEAEMWREFARCQIEYFVLDPTPVDRLRQSTAELRVFANYFIYQDGGYRFRLPLLETPESP